MQTYNNDTPTTTKRQSIHGLALFALLAFSSLTNAATVTYQSTTGTWTNYTYNTSTAPYASDFIQGVGTSNLYWGEPYYASNGPQESMIFQGNNNSTTPGSSPFAIGWLTHSNNAIYGDTNITSANLSLQLSLTGSSAFNFNYTFNIAQDTNTYADTLSFSPVGSTQFSLDGQLYSFNLLGFYNQGSIYSQILVGDGATVTQAPLYASITTIGVTPVPAPAALWLLGSGLLCLTGFAKRKRTA